MSLIEKCKRKNPLDYIHNRTNNLVGKSCQLELILIKIGWDLGGAYKILC